MKKIVEPLKYYYECVVVVPKIHQVLYAFIFFFADMVSILHLITMTMNYTVVDIQGSGELMEGNVEFVATHGTQNRYVILRYILNAVVFCQPSSVLRSGKRARSGLRGLFLGPVLL